MGGGWIRSLMGGWMEDGGYAQFGRMIYFYMYLLL